MFKLLKGGICYGPQEMGKKDILTAFNKIYKIEDNISEEKLLDVEVLDCSGKIIIPGLIDQHVHILGGGGEEGPASRIPEIMLGEVISSGVSTLVGVLGFDSITRSISNLLAKANALSLEGIRSYIYTGSYAVPTATLTGKVITDITLIDRVIGVGEVALADHRSSHPDLQTLKQLASEARVGGLIGSKAGVVHIHVGDGKEGLSLLFKLIEDSDFPIEMFVPTHINRNKKLFEQGIEYVNMGGFIDITAGESSENGYSIPDALEKLIKGNVNMNNITASSDGNGSNPPRNGKSGGICKMTQLIDDLRVSILDRKLPIPQVIQTVTSNVANILKIFPKKGTLSVGSDADIVVLDNNDLKIDTMIVGGEILIRDRVILKKGNFEA